MPDEHARLSPSASKRWLSCPASVRLGESAPRQASSSYADEGTSAHTLGEITAARALGLISESVYRQQHAAWRTSAEAAGYDIDEMEEHAAAYAALLVELRDTEPWTAVFLEQRVQTGVPLCWGTSDSVLVSPRVVHIVDLKYGQGVRVDAEENPQLMLYGVGALESLGDVLGDVEVVRMTIFQPRLSHVSTFEMSAADLVAWRDSIISTAEEAIAGSDRFGPSEDACRWCPVKGTCRARTEWATRQDFTAQTDLLSLEELGELLGELPAIRQWIKDVDEEAFRRAYGESETIPGWKVVLSGGQRRITDTTAALGKLTAAGLTEEQVTKPQVVQLLGLGDLEKQLKTLPKIKPEGATRPRAQRLEDVLGTDLVQKSPGAPALVHESDPRPPIDPTAGAQHDFAQPADD